MWPPEQTQTFRFPNILNKKNVPKKQRIATNRNNPLNACSRWQDIAHMLIGQHLGRKLSS